MYPFEIQALATFRSGFNFKPKVSKKEKSSPIEHPRSSGNPCNGRETEGFIYLANRRQT